MVTGKNDKTGEIFKALADPTRRHIFTLLVGASGALSLTQLANQVSMTRQGTTKHIKQLESAGMIKTLSQGRERFCIANIQALSEIRNWLALYDKHWDDSIKRLEKFLSGQMI